MTDVPEPLPSTPAPQAVSMDFSLHGSGWASFTVKCGDRAFSVENFGYCTDGLGDLVRAALSIATGASYAEVLFDCEPQVWGLAIEPAGLSPQRKRVVRLTIKDGGMALTDAGHSGLRVWQWPSPAAMEGYVTTDGFASAVQSIAAMARAEFDDATYRDGWRYFGSLEGFPLRGLRALETALAIPEYRE